MRPRLKTLLLCVVVVTAALILGSHFLLHGAVASDTFRRFAEAELGELFSSEVSIGKIHTRFFYKIVFTDLDVRRPEGSDSSSLRIPSIVFRYDPLRVLGQRFRSPAGVVLEAPNVNLAGTSFLAGLNQTGLGTNPNGFSALSNLALEGGTIDYVIPHTGTNLHIRDVWAQFRAVDKGKTLVDLRGRMEGVADGQLHIHGTLSAAGQPHDLVMDFEASKTDNSRKSPTKLNAKITWAEDRISFNRVNLNLQGWELGFEGSLQPLSAYPTLNLRCTVTRGVLQGEVSMTADLTSERIVGTFKRTDGEVDHWQGRISRRGASLKFEELVWDTGLTAKGQFNFDSGDYNFDFEHGRQRWSILSNWQGRDVGILVDINHAKLAGLDVTTRGGIHLKPKDSWDGARRFQADFRSDYFLLEQMPLHDFKGSFELTAAGIENLLATWGGVFGVQGDVLLEENAPEASLVVHVTDFDLSKLQDYAIRPLPKPFGGFLEGRLKVEGALDNPELIGDFRVKNGLLRRLDYDRAIVHVRGYLPYLALQDSKVLRGRSTLYLKGALDFSLQNAFHGVRIETADKLVLWKGVSIGTSAAEEGVEFAPSMEKFPLMRLVLEGKGRDSTGDPDQLQDEGYIAAGPKIQF
ncbi:MAG: hypothetical protein Q8R76_02585 [Candidatus Omnitrophota bacterium]|nr:hypothetical protein [Candidatus Omnitrophota bacterium]